MNGLGRGSLFAPKMVKLLGGVKPHYVFRHDRWVQAVEIFCDIGSSDGLKVGHLFYADTKTGTRPFVFIRGTSNGMIIVNPRNDEAQFI